MAAKKKMYESLSQDIADIYSSGEAIGLSEFEIDACLERATSAGTDECVDRGKTSRAVWLASLCCHSVFQAYRLCVLGTVAILVSFACLYVLTSLWQPADAAVGSVLRQVAHPVLRLARHITLPLWKHMEMTALHDLDCLLSNPSYNSESELQCGFCVDLSKAKVSSKKKLNRFRNEYLGSYYPVVFKDAFTDAVTYETLRDAVLLHDDTYRGGFVVDFSSNPHMLQVNQILRQYSRDNIQKNLTFASSWTSRRGHSAWILKHIFGVPYFVPSKAEQGYKTSVHLCNEMAKPFQIHVPSKGHTWYFQAAGTRTLVLTPRGNCLHHCKPMEITLRSPETVYINTYFWTIGSLATPAPYRQSIDVSMAYLSTFQL